MPQSQTATGTALDQRSRTERAAQLMLAFAGRTGLTSSVSPQRYLWTDAFAVCNFLELARRTGEARYSELALRLVDQVHHTLGRHRADDARTGWISGLSEEEGEVHPTRGGLRIGKKLPEQGPSESSHDPLEWERDGQYFHYLTRWMHALDQVFRYTGQLRFNRWARELAAVAARTFSVVTQGGGPPRLVWKMSIDLLRPLVSSTGQHDALDGFITSAQLQSTVDARPGIEGPDLKREMARFATMIEMRNCVTTDPLGIGGLLMDAARVAQLTQRHTSVNEVLLQTLLAASLAGIRRYALHPDLRAPASRRLAFRELGVVIGLSAIGMIENEVTAEPPRFKNGADLRARLADFRPFLPLGPSLGSFWLNPMQRDVRSWIEHRDINDVMLATALIPEGYLILPLPQ